MSGAKVMQAVLDHLEMQPHPFALSVGLERSQSIYDIIDGKIIGISSKLADKIRKEYPQFNKGWLMSGEGEMLVKKTNGQDLLHEAEEAAKNKHQARMELVKPSSTLKPIFNVYGTAGATEIFNDNSEYIEGYNDVPEFGDIVGYVWVWGNSMYPKYCNGDMVACREIKKKHIIPYGEAYLIITEEHRMIKYIDPFDGDDQKLTIRSEHPDHKPFTIMREEILRLYAIKGKITKSLI